ncbi:MAG TPA: hypothetical protein VJ904_12730, partial [Tichowtungia sp.]|nr:hypothetical protein [Tichowtungia sp.]
TTVVASQPQPCCTGQDLKQIGHSQTGLQMAALRKIKSIYSSQHRESAASEKKRSGKWLLGQRAADW